MNPIISSFTFNCRKCTIPCKILKGHKKGVKYQPGHVFEEGDMGGKWCAVHVDGQWRFIDIHWASEAIVGHKKEEWQLVEADGNAVDSDTGGSGGQLSYSIREFYFFTDPDVLIYNHFPNQPEWQLLQTYRTIDEFESMPFVKQGFFTLGMTFQKSSNHCFIKSRTGEVELRFTLPEEKANELKFTNNFYKNRKNTIIKKTKSLDRCVLQNKTSNELTYTIRFQSIGRYKLEIICDYSDILEYIFECTKIKKDLQPLPDNPQIGWGPDNDAATRVGLEATTHKDGIIKTNDGIVEIRFYKSESMSFLQNLRHNDLDEWLLKRHAIIHIEENIMILTVRLPKKGEYALKLFADENGEKDDMTNVCNYLLQCANESVESLPYPKLHNGLLGKGPLSEQLEVNPISHKDGKIETKDGRLKVVFSCPSDIILLSELHNATTDRRITADQMKRGVHEKEERVTFDMKLKSHGEYGLNVYAIQESEPDRLYHVFTYLIEYIPDKENPKQKQQQKRKPTPDVSTTVETTTEDEYEISYSKGMFPLVAELQNKDALGSPPTEKLASQPGKHKEVFKVKLPQPGDYKLDIYEARKNGALVHVHSVNIIRKEPQPETSYVEVS